MGAARWVGRGRTEPTHRGRHPVRRGDGNPTNVAMTLRRKRPSAQPPVVQITPMSEGEATLRRQEAGTVLVVAGTIGLVIAAFLPWGGSGRVDRSSFAIVSAAERLDLLDGPAQSLSRGWYLVPLLGAAVWLAAATGRTRLARVLGTIVAVAGVLLSIAVHRSPLLPRVGPSATIGAAVVVGLGLVLGLAPRRRRSTGS
jgi:hypothetical protein